MQQLVSEVSNLCKIEPERVAETCKATLFPRRVIPLCNEICEGLFNLSLNRNDAELVTEADDHHKIRLAVPSRRSQIHFTLEKAIDQLGSRIFRRGRESRAHCRGEIAMRCCPRKREFLRGISFLPVKFPLCKVGNDVFGLQEGNVQSTEQRAL